MPGILQYVALPRTKPVETGSLSGQSKCVTALTTVFELLSCSCDLYFRGVLFDSVYCLTLYICRPIVLPGLYCVIFVSVTVAVRGDGGWC